MHICPRLPNISTQLIWCISGVHKIILLISYRCFIWNNFVVVLLSSNFNLQRLRNHIENQLQVHHLYKITWICSHQKPNKRKRYFCSITCNKNACWSQWCLRPFLWVDCNKSHPNMCNRCTQYFWHVPKFEQEFLESPTLCAANIHRSPLYQNYTTISQSITNWKQCHHHPRGSML